MGIRKYKRRTKVKSSKGGGLVPRGAVVVSSLIDEIIGLFQNPIFVSEGTTGIVFSTRDEFPLMWDPHLESPAKFIVKIIPMEGYPAEEAAFDKECDFQKQIYIKLLKEFRYSFVPMVVHYKIYTEEEFGLAFPALVDDEKVPEEFKKYIEGREVEKFGVIIMESFGDVKTLKETDRDELPIALREMYMLAQVGYKDESRSLDNFLISGGQPGSKRVYMIDFGSTESIYRYINPAQSEIEVLSEIYKSDLIEEGEPQDLDLIANKIINLTNEVAPANKVWGPLLMKADTQAASLQLMRILHPVKGRAVESTESDAKRSKNGGKKSRRKRIKAYTQKTMVPH